MFDRGVSPRGLYNFFGDISICEIGIRGVINMKKHYLLIGALVVSMVFILNNINMLKHEGNECLDDEKIENFALDHNINILSVENLSNYSIISYDTISKYGIMSLFIDKQTGDIGYIDNNVNLSSNTDKLVHLQFTLENVDSNFIGIYIVDTELVRKAKDITIEFKKNTSEDGTYKITISTNKHRSVLISYIDKRSLKDVQRITILDENGNIIHTKTLIEKITI